MQLLGHIKVNNEQCVITGRLGSTSEHCDATYSSYTIIAERLSARHIIVTLFSLSVYIYVCHA